MRFPEGRKTDGYIKNVYPLTQPLPPEFQKKYEPVRRCIVADIELEKDLDDQEYGDFSLVGVKIYVPRFQKRRSKIWK